MVVGRLRRPRQAEQRPHLFGVDVGAIRVRAVEHDSHEVPADDRHREDGRRVAWRQAIVMPADLGKALWFVFSQMLETDGIIMLDGARGRAAPTDVGHS